MNSHGGYPCHGYHKDLPGGRASGEFHVGPAGFEFSIGGKRGRIPFEGADLKLGGASDRLVFISHPAVPEWTLYTSDLEILKDPELNRHPRFAGQLGKARGRRRRNWGLLALVAAVIIALPALALMRMDLLTGFIAPRIPLQWERQLGDSSLAQYRLSHSFVEEARGQALLRPLVTPLLEAVAADPASRGYEYQFHIVHDASLNAFALPGGQVVIHSGLILEAGRAEELLGVLAHEIMHVERQHGIRNIIGTLGIYLTLSALLGDMQGILASVASSAPLLLRQSYSRRFEKEADTQGFELLQKARVDPGGMADFFARMVAEEKSRLAGITDEKTRSMIKDTLGILSSHPASEDRIAYLQALKADAPASAVDLSRAFMILQNAVKQSVIDDNPEPEPEAQ